MRIFENHWNKYVIISVAVHVAILSIPVTMIVREQLKPIEVSLVTQENEPPPKPEARKMPLPKPEAPKPIRMQEKPQQAQRPEEPKDVKAQIVSPGERTVMQVAPGVGDGATGVGIAGAKAGGTGTVVGGSMPGGTGNATAYGYGGVVEGQFGRGEGPSFAHREAPEYPVAAKRQGKEGRVILRVTIDAKGRLEGVDVVETSDEVFVEPAVDSIKKSRFLPGRKNGIPSRYKCKLAIRFTLGA